MPRVDTRIRVDCDYSSCPIRRREASVCDDGGWDRRRRSLRLGRIQAFGDREWFESLSNARARLRHGNSLKLSALGETEVLFRAGGRRPRQGGQERYRGSGKDKWNGQCRRPDPPSHGLVTFIWK